MPKVCKGAKTEEEKNCPRVFKNLTVHTGIVELMIT
jgi:hypothetical protein